LNEQEKKIWDIFQKPTCLLSKQPFYSWCHVSHSQLVEKTVTSWCKANIYTNKCPKKKNTWKKLGSDGINLKTCYQTHNLEVLHKIERSRHRKYADSLNIILVLKILTTTGSKSQIFSTKFFTQTKWFPRNKWFKISNTPAISAKHKFKRQN